MSSVKTVECPSCGLEHPAGVNFCSECGTPFAPSTAPFARSDSVYDTVDDNANGIGGAPVANTGRGGSEPFLEVRGSLQGLVGEVQNSLSTVVQDMRGTIKEVVEEAQRSARTAMPQLRPQTPPPPARRPAPNLSPVLGRTFSRMLAPRSATPPPPVPARVVWFIFAGIWLTPLWIVATWLTMLSVIGIPITRRMLDLAPTVMTLRPAGQAVQGWRLQRALLPITRSRLTQIDLPTRAVYFVFVGWWVSLVWMLLAYAVSLTGVGIPVSYKMLDRAPTVAHLERR